MEFTTRHIGAYGGRPAKMIELTATDGNATITLDVTDLNDKVDEALIQRLRDLADEFEEQNSGVDKYYTVS